MFLDKYHQLQMLTDLAFHKARCVMLNRKYGRARTDIGAHFIVNGARAGTGVALNLSAGGLSVASDLAVNVNDEITIDLFGGARFQGKVVHLFDGGFGMSLEMTDRRRCDLSDAVNAFFERDLPPRELRMERRAQTRSPLFGAETTCQTAEGEIRCRVCDVTLEATRIETDARLQVGDRICVGRADGTIVRKSGSSYGVRFDHAFSTQGAGLNALGIHPEPEKTRTARRAASR